MACMLLACTSSGKGYESIDAKQAKEKMKEDVVIVDVRTQAEYEQGHIEDAVNIPLDAMDTIEEIVTDKSKPLLIYCRSGNRSAQAAQKLVEMQYEKVYDFGGIQDWTYEIVK